MCRIILFSLNFLKCSVLCLHSPERGTITLQSETSLISLSYSATCSLCSIHSWPKGQCLAQSSHSIKYLLNEYDVHSEQSLLSTNYGWDRYTECRKIPDWYIGSRSNSANQLAGFLIYSYIWGYCIEENEFCHQADLNSDPSYHCLSLDKFLDLTNSVTAKPSLDSKWKAFTTLPNA